MNFLTESPPLELEPRVGEYLSRLEQRIQELEKKIHDHDPLYTLPAHVKPGMVRFFGAGDLWPDQTDGGNQNRNGTNNGNGPGPSPQGSGDAGLYQYVDYDTGWEPLGGDGGDVFTSPLTTTGDLYAYDTADARLPVGTDGQVLTADSGESTGIKWATPSSGGGVVTQVAFDPTPAGGVSTSWSTICSITITKLSSTSVLYCIGQLTAWEYSTGSDPNYFDIGIVSSGAADSALARSSGTLQTVDDNAVSGGDTAVTNIWSSATCIRGISGLGAGSRTIQLRAKCDASAYTPNYGQLLVLEVEP